MSDMITLTIDGQEVTVPKGTNVLEAAKTIGIDISHFCYHPGLSSPAVCRQCLVGVEKAPKLQPACYTPCSDGQVIDTASDTVKAARQQMLEFTLVNHPIDCPVCDKAGECSLQRLYFEHDGAASRVAVTKVTKRKKHDIGPHIVLDQERCILCTRCVRVCDEVAGQPQLTMAYRGNHEVLTTAPGESLDNPYSLNTVDVCPVGALTAKDFRFTLRAWELMMTPSVCNGCATGCNVEVHHRGGKVYRMVPRHNDDVNKYWMCDEGRFTYHELEKERLAVPVLDGMPADLDGALKTAADRLVPILDADRDSVGVVLSATNSNEDNYALGRLARHFLSLDRIYVSGRPDDAERADDILRAADQNPNTNGAKIIAGDMGNLVADLETGKLRALIVLGECVQLSDGALTKAKALDALIVLATHERGITPHAHVALPIAAWTESHGTITSKDQRTQRLHAMCEPPGLALPGWDMVARLGRRLGATINYTDAQSVFAEMVEDLTAFDSAAWGEEVPSQLLRFAGSRG